MAACSLGRGPRARVARRNLALSDSIAFVESITRRISGEESKNGTNSDHADVHNERIAG